MLHQTKSSKALCFATLITLFIACDKNQESNTQPLQQTQAQIKTEIQTPISSFLWNGNGETYCALQNHEIQAYFCASCLDHVRSREHQPTRENAQTLYHEGKIQESIWELEETGNALDKKTAHSYKRNLFRILKHGKFIHVKANLGGTLEKHLLEFSHGIQAVFKPTAVNEGMWWANSQSEAAAYKLDNILETHLVPMTIIRVIDSKEGSLQYFIKGSTQGRAELMDTWNFSSLKVLDYIFGNTDRCATNFLYLQSLDRLIAIDNGESFSETRQCSTPEITFEYLKKDPKLMNHFLSYNLPNIASRLKVYIDPAMITVVLERIENLKNLAQNYLASEASTN